MVHESHTVVFSSRVQMCYCIAFNISLCMLFIQANEPAKSNISDIRCSFREETLQRELEHVCTRAFWSEDKPTTGSSSTTVTSNRNIPSSNGGGSFKTKRSVTDHDGAELKRCRNVVELAGRCIERPVGVVLVNHLTVKSLGTNTVEGRQTAHATASSSLVGLFEKACKKSSAAVREALVKIVES